MPDDLVELRRTILPKALFEPPGPWPILLGLNPDETHATMHVSFKPKDRRGPSEEESAHFIAKGRQALYERALGIVAGELCALGLTPDDQEVLVDGVVLGFGDLMFDGRSGARPIAVAGVRDFPGAPGHCFHIRPGGVVVRWELGHEYEVKSRTWTLIAEIQVELEPNLIHAHSIEYALNWLS